jgi:serine/threonine-protein kinase SRPK3
MNSTISESGYDFVDEACREHESDNGLNIEGISSGLEKVYDYEPGGHHPVRLGDILVERYKVIHKLGSGGYANVWLCRDTAQATNQYVAVKIIMAEGSTPECPELRVNKLHELGTYMCREAFCLPLDHFSITGPNGSHYAFIYPVLGPRVSRLFTLAGEPDLEVFLRRVSLQVTRALAVLHSHGICHGGTSPLSYSS